MSVILQPIDTDFLTVLNKHLAEPYDHVRIAVAWAREDAIVKILPALKEFVKRGGHVEVVVGLNDKGTTYEALKHLLTVADVHVFYKHSAQTFHPKLFVFENQQRSRATVIVGSNNLTIGGVWSNFELSLKLDLDLTQENQKRTYKEIDAAFLAIKRQPHRKQITSENGLKQLLDADLIMHEHEIRRRRRISRQPRHAPVPSGIAADLLLNASPPKPFTRGTGERRRRVPRAVRFAGVPALYVRTFTENEIRKIYRRIPGTLEFGIPLYARSEAPQFWRWLDTPPYQRRRTTSGRTEWEWYTRALLIFDSRSVVSPIRLWDYARRHEFRVQVDLRPSHVTRDDVLVFERTDTPSYDFIIRHVQKGNTQFDAYAAYLSKRAAQHLYGYGP